MSISHFKVIEKILSGTGTALSMPNLDTGSNAQCGSNHPPQKHFRDSFDRPTGGRSLRCAYRYYPTQC